MKFKVKALMALCMCLLMVLSFGQPAKADDELKEWTVTFKEDGTSMDDGGFTAEQLNYNLAGLQPGDSMTFKINLKNAYKDSTDWYMINDVLKTLEEQNFDAEGNPVASAGAYTYILTFKGPDNAEEQVIYSSDTVGGENSNASVNGLHEATETLNEDFFLFTLKNGQSGYVSLYVLLDGETQGNAYQDTLAQLKLQFSVTTDEQSVPPRKPPNTPATGDSSNPVPYFIAMGVSGLIILLLAILLMVRRKKMAEEK